jgi:hypothetical protein
MRRPACSSGLGLLLLFLAACAAAPPPIPPLPSEGGPTWFELTSDHFTVWTDGPPARARELVRTMERLRKVVLGVSFFQSDSPARSFVIAFRNLEEVHAYVPSQFIAHAWSARNLLAQPVIVLSLSSLENDLRIVTHELTHVIAFNVIPDQPKWFSEGLAGYFETVRLDEGRGKVDVGRPFRLQQIRATGLVPTSALFACEQAACIDDRFYATTWAVVTYLINNHPTSLVRYLERLRETPKAGQAALWAEVFPALPPAKLDRELASWIAYGKITVNEYDAAFEDVVPVERPLGDADAYAARGLLRYLFTPTEVPSEVTRALALAPRSVLPNLIQAAAKKSYDADTARAVAAAHPDDWRAWFLVAVATQGTPESQDARIKLCALLEKNPAALPPQMCAPAALDPSNDPRRAVLASATPLLNKCFALANGKLDPGGISMEIEIAASGAVITAKATFGSPSLDACVEGVLRSLRFPANLPGTFRVGTPRAPKQ